MAQRKRYFLSKVKQMSSEELRGLASSVRSYLIDQNLSAKDVQVKLDISDEALRYVQNVCDIHKSRQQITETMQKTNKKRYGTDYFDVSASNTITLLKYQQLSGDKRLELQHNFQHEYIDNDNSIESVCSILNINAELATYLKNVLRISKSNVRQLQTKRKTSMNRYRTEWPTQSEQVKKKIRQTCRDRYGHDSYFETAECNDAAKQRNLEKYGAEYYLKSNEGRQQFVNSMQRNHGVNYTAESEALQQKMQRTCMSKYGVPYYQQSVEGKSHISQAQLQLNEFAKKVLSGAHYLQKYIYLLPPGTRTIENIAATLGAYPQAVSNAVDRYNSRDLIDKVASTSRFEEEVTAFVSIMGKWSRNVRDVIPPRELDLYFDFRKFAIECNGTYWHSDINVKPYYHQSKSTEAADRGIQVYHIFEYEWNDPIKCQIIKSQLSAKLHWSVNRIYARKCNIVALTAADCREFLTLNHLQGFRSGSYYIGLTYDNLLVAVLVMGKPYLSSMAEWEVYRFCVIQGVSVVGGFGRLFAKFVRDCNPVSVCTFSDIAKGTGDVYGKCGFQFVRITSPNYVWVKGADVRSRYQCQMLNESSKMRSAGYLRVYDCGSKLWLWNSEENVS